MSIVKTTTTESKKQKDLQSTVTLIKGEEREPYSKRV